MGCSEWLGAPKWITIRGLQIYGYSSLAKEIAGRWIRLNEEVFRRTGKLMEKYNVVDISLEAGGGEYEGQDGFGWTNGVYLALTDQYKTTDRWEQQLAMVSLLVKDYDEAIEFYTRKLGFQLLEDNRVTGTKRWVVVAPPGSTSSLLLAKAATIEQEKAVGQQTGGFFIPAHR